jgi:folate-binding protein YgfZ
MTDIASQYRTTADGAGWAVKTARGRLRFDGRDGRAFLQALVSNDVGSLEEGRGVYAVYLTPKGRMLADMRLYHRGGYLLADVPASEAASLAARFDGLIFTEDVRVADVSAAFQQLAVAGTDADAVIARAFSFGVDVVRALPVLAQLRVPGGFVVRTDDADRPSFDVFVDSGADGTARAEIVRALEAAGAVSITAEALEGLRIEAGRPAFGQDMTAETIPLEAGLLDRAISTTKGCYVGQEVIVRVLHRGGGRVVKRLVKLDIRADRSAPPEAGAPIFDAGRAVGALTSIASAPARDGFVGLGYVHRDSAEPGRSLTIGDAATATAEITGFAG